jgi:drug/metabolite transporter (DMT)-like permease
MTGSRFLLAGLLLLLGVALFDRAGHRRGTLREWIEAGKISFPLLVLGIAVGNWVQQYVDSSFAAMVFSALPLWTVLIDWIRPGGQAPSRLVGASMVLGFIGVSVILLPVQKVDGTPFSLVLDLLLVVASIAWASGAIFSRHLRPARGSALLPVARQMVIAGAVLLLVGLAEGDGARLRLEGLRSTVWIGFGYLVLIGSLAGYPVYLWLMRVCAPAKAATIPYLNLLVAIFLGWSLGHEGITARLLIGTAIVLLSVALVLRSKPAAAVPVD